MNIYVVFAYSVSFALILGELVRTFFCYTKSKKVLDEIAKNNEKKI
ncbi:MAG: hypothetical protein QWI36_03315 [Wolbachia endosymbiont of Tyrophagus putrescentiae]|nr:hypothetical protein [Wolbachia endosymbiont of Tyrophagus putrescentiae]